MPGNKTLIFKSIPNGLLIPGKDLVVESLPFDPASRPPRGGVTVEVLYSSFGPYLRGLMRAESEKSYFPALPLGSPVVNDAVARVLQSDSSDFAPGDVIAATLPIAEYAVFEKEALPWVCARIGSSSDGPKDLGMYLGPLGMAGLTGFSSLYEIGKPKKGETIFISSAAGAVGQMFGQIAKKEGLRVVGSVGNDDKLDFILKELKFDAGFNYKKEKPADALKRLAPEELNLEAALDKMNDWGRIVACGMISGYNTPVEQWYGVKNLFHVVAKRITMQGFIVSDKDFWPKYAQKHQETVQKWLAEGSYVSKLHVTEGIDNAAEGLVGILQGNNFGKAILKIRD